MNEIVTKCVICGKPLTEDESRSPDPEAYGEKTAELDFCLKHYKDLGYFDSLEFEAKGKIIPATGRNKGRVYHRVELEIELPRELREWSLVPAYLYGAEVWMWQDVLHVKLRKSK